MKLILSILLLVQCGVLIQAFESLEEYEARTEFEDYEARRNYKREPAPGNSDCFEYNTDYRGYDLTDVGRYTKDARLCQELCKDTAGCNFWSRKQNGRCYVKKRKAGRIGQSNTVSGPKSCAALSDCFEFHIDYSGYDVTGVGQYTRDARACQQLCKKTAGCNFWSRKQNGRCYTKKSKAGRTVQSNTVSGSKSCAETITWRDDGRCKNQEISAGSCDPLSGSPCCSASGYCGSGNDYCTCSRCDDYREIPYTGPAMGWDNLSEEELEAIEEGWKE